MKSGVKRSAPCVKCERHGQTEFDRDTRILIRDTRYAVQYTKMDVL